MTDRILPAGRIVKVEFEVCLPAAATEDQIEEWVTYSLGVGGMALDSPLIDRDPEPFGHSVMLRDTELQGREERFNERREGDKTYYSVRYVRERAA